MSNVTPILTNLVDTSKESYHSVSISFSLLRILAQSHSPQQPPTTHNNLTTSILRSSRLCWGVGRSRWVPGCSWVPPGCPHHPCPETRVLTAVRQVACWANISWSNPPATRHTPASTKSIQDNFVETHGGNSWALHAIYLQDCFISGCDNLWRKPILCRQMRRMVWKSSDMKLRSNVPKEYFND